MKILLLSVIVLAVLAFGYANADTIDFTKCEQNADHHCYSFSPKLNQAGGTNVHVELHLPQNGANTIDGIYSPDNYTNLQQNPAVISVQNIYTTTSSPTLNYCPDALYILVNQGTPEYLDQFYKQNNGTVILDLTNYVYPSWCHRESGPNPVNGDNTQVVPEFSQTVGIVSAIAILSAIVFTAHREIRK